MHAQLIRIWSSHFSLWMQILFALSALVVWAIVPGCGGQFFGVVERSLSLLAARKAVAIAIIFLATIAIRITLLPVIGVPFPAIHDEHSYLLMSEMFAKGRLAYPSPALWRSLETFHVNFFPVYASMYPPAQGAALALGRLLGDPWIGVLLSVAAMDAAIVWMLQAWMPSRWAFLGGVLAASNLAVASYWVNSYWGGAVAAIGGALVLGAWPRIVRAQRLRDGLLLGLGVAILANSRPYEGMLLCIPVVGWSLWWLVARAKVSPRWHPALRVMIAAGAVICATAGFMLYYNWRLTGNALLMPHALNYRVYSPGTAVFLWQRPSPPTHSDNPQFDSFYNGWLRGMYHRTLRDALRVSGAKIRNLTSVFLWPGVFPALLCVPFALRDRRVRFLFVELFVGLAGLFLVVPSLPHYSAPFTCVFYGVVVQGFRHMRTISFRARPVGIGLARASLVLLLLNTGFDVYQLVRTPSHTYSYRWSWNKGRGNPGAFGIEEQLKNLPGKHLIIVHYAANHDPHDEWVHNHADIDGSKVVWARELDPEQNARLFTYFSNRQIWLFEPDSDKRKLLPLELDRMRSKGFRVSGGPA
jgi:hypothetical protein